MIIRHRYTCYQQFCVILSGRIKGILRMRSKASLQFLPVIQPICITGGTFDPPTQYNTKQMRLTKYTL